MQNFDREARLKASGVLFDLIEKSEISFRDLNLSRKIFLFAGIFHGIMLFQNEFAGGNWLVFSMSVIIN